MRQIHAYGAMIHPSSSSTHIQVFLNCLYLVSEYINACDGGFNLATQHSMLWVLRVDPSMIFMV